MDTTFGKCRNDMPGSGSNGIRAACCDCKERRQGMRAMTKTCFRFAVAILAYCGAVAQLRADTEIVDGIEWNFTISGWGAILGDGSVPAVPTSTTGAITIPTSLGDCPVTSIGDYAFYSCSNLTSVTIHESVDYIGNNAFYGCSCLTNVTIPDGVTQIGNSTFYGCCSLTNLKIPDGVTRIGNNAFYGCNGLTSIVIPDSVTRIEYDAFSLCSGVKNVTISQYINNSTLSSIFPSAYQTITNVVVSGSVTGIANSTFAGCSDLVSVVLPESVTQIGDSAFDGCGKMVNATLPRGVTCIGSYAFRGCRSLTSLEIPKSVVDIGPGAFGMCGKLSVHVSADNENYMTSDGMLLSKDGKILFYGENGAGDIPDSVEVIADYALAGRSDLVRVVIHGGVTNIGEYAFAYCDGLTAVEIPNSVKAVGVGAFAYCNNLKSAMVPQCICAVASTDSGIVYSGSAYNGAVITGTCGISIAFGCESMSIYSGNSYYGSIIMYPCYPALTNIVVAPGTTLIADSAFADCKYLQSVTIPSSVTRIGDGAFKDCTSLSGLSFEGDAPDVGTDVLLGTLRRLEVKVQDGTVGWSGGGASELPSAWCDRAIVYAGGAGTSGGGPSGVGTVVVTNDCRYALTDYAADRAIASVTVDCDCSIDEFVLKDGKVFDCVLYISNVANEAVTLTLPAGNEYKAFKGAKPLTIPANSQHIITITRVADRTFLVSREELETLQ